MEKKKLFVKYAILILVYTFFNNIIQPFGFKLYYTIYSDPELNPLTIQNVQSILTGFTFFMNLLMVIFVLIDSKNKKLLDWLIAVIVFFRPGIGLILFLIWQIYKEINQTQGTTIYKQNAAN